MFSKLRRRSESLGRVQKLEKTEQEKTKGQTTSVYLNAESLRYLDKLVEMRRLAGHKSDRSKMVSQLILWMKHGSLAYLSMLGDDKSDIAEVIRKMAGRANIYLV